MTHSAIRSWTLWDYVGICAVVGWAATTGSSAALYECNNGCYLRRDISLNQSRAGVGIELLCGVIGQVNAGVELVVSQSDGDGGGLE